MYHKVLVLMDGSEIAECVLPHVRTLVDGGCVGTVVFLSVVEPFGASVASAYVVNDAERQRIEAEETTRRRQYLAELVERAQLGPVNVQVELVYGGAGTAQAIVNYAEGTGVDLIVMATHGRSGIGRWVFGSVADRVLHTTRLPLLMVRVPGWMPGP